MKCHNFIGSTVQVSIFVKPYEIRNKFTVYLKQNIVSVSYTHLDVYKRQQTHRQTRTQTLFGKRLFFMF